MKIPTNTPSRPRNKDRDGEEIHLVEPPAGAIENLEKHARLDLQIARLTLGLYQTIYAAPPNRLFPGYQWEQRDVNDFPAGLKESALRLLMWGQQRYAVLNELVASTARIEAAVQRRRQASPLGKKWIEVADRLRRKHSSSARRPPASPRPGPKAPTTIAVDILPELIGRPLSDRTLRLIKSFCPVSIRILRNNDQWLFSQEPTVVAIRLSPNRFSVQSIIMFVVAPPSVAMGRKIEGSLEDFSETGTEGVLWALIDDQNFGYEALHLIDEGDHLTITDQLGSELWSGIIRCDRRPGRRRSTLNPKYVQPAALGYWIHWTQRGFRADDWARFFIRPRFDRLRGVLIKKPTTNPHAATAEM